MVLSLMEKEFRDILICHEHLGTKTESQIPLSWKSTLLIEINSLTSVQVTLDGGGYMKILVTQKVDIKKPALEIQTYIILQNSINPRINLLKTWSFT